MKVVHVSSVHGRYDTRIFLKECRWLAAGGHEVTFIVADGNGDEVRDGVRILDVGQSRNRGERFLGAVNRAANAGIRLRADIYHLHDPELLRIASKLRRLVDNARIIFDAHEDFPRQVLSKDWIPSMLRRPVAAVAELIENRVARKLTGVVAATPHIASRFGSVCSRVVNVNNFPMLEELVSVEPIRTRRSYICYVGGITRIRGIVPLIDALPLVPNVRLVLCGEFSGDGLEDEVRAAPGWSQVDYRGHVSRAGVRQVLGECMAGIVTFLPEPNHIDAQPNKMFEYMSAELPVIASDFSLWRRLVDEAGAGICVNPQSPAAIAGAIQMLLDDPAEIERMGKAGRRAVLEHYNWPNEAAKLLRFYEDMM
ncbi:MAG: glycosyltransferase family 4 protein [Proteobacteria bacterium]|nr:glycosyltransferase family 4 protein [Pseudomonadota bacterium]